jgi:hypothetical protein
MILHHLHLSCRSARFRPHRLPYNRRMLEAIVFSSTNDLSLPSHLSVPWVSVIFFAFLVLVAVTVVKKQSGLRIA